jgi:hypothetical protein
MAGVAKCSWAGARPVKDFADAALIVGASLPMVIAGVTLMAGGGGGLYWLLPEVLLALLGAVTNAWVLLVEIHR